MTPLPAAADDVRAFYAALGIELPGWAHTEAPVRCFVNPDAHQHDDRNASCSVRLGGDDAVAPGVFHCHGCGARGGAYDAAIALGLSPRTAMDLLITHGLAERRVAGAPLVRRARNQPVAPRPAPRSAAAHPAAISTDALHDARRRLGEVWPLRVLRDEQRATWRLDTLQGLGCGWDGRRLLFPVTDAASSPIGLLRYAPRHDHAPKMLAVTGTRLGLLPHPETVARTRWAVICEGPPDMLSARSCGLPAFGVPGDDAWRPEWAQLFAGRFCTIVMDCDPPGRAAAQRIRDDLARVAARPIVVDLAPARADGFDLTEWLAAAEDRSPRELARALGWRPEMTLGSGGALAAVARCREGHLGGFEARGVSL
jgi:hypothetical protein